MSPSETDLLQTLTLERLEVDLFRGSGAGGLTERRIFGGQVIAQALSAAYRTVPGDRLCHSLHAYFIRPGDTSIPVVYSVDRARDGGSFTTRRVVAIQHGQQILNMSASFHVDEEGWDYQHPMPGVERPEHLPSLAELLARRADAGPAALQRRADRHSPFDIRIADPVDPIAPAPTTDRNHFWIRMGQAEGHDQPTQQILLAYVSDMQLLSSGARPHGLSWFSGEMMGASLDHAMWFHNPVSLFDWNLYAMESPFTGRGRSMNRGMIYGADGTVIASVAQEGLMRRVRRKPGSDS